MTDKASRANVLKRLQEVLGNMGERRRAALAAADEELDQIAECLPVATALGLSLTEVGKLTGLSRPTLYALRKRPVGDRRFDVLASLATRPVSLEELARQLDIDPDQLGTVVEDLAGREWLTTAVTRYGPGTDVTYLFVTQQGEEALAEWASSAVTAARSKPARLEGQR